MKFCPQCGTTFEPDARFCLECGFDLLSVEADNTGSVAPESTVQPEEPESAEPARLCPQCKTVLAPDDRFCLECGFDTVITVAPLPEIPVVETPLAEPEIVLSGVKTETIAEEVKKVCPKCSTGLEKDERFCHNCGFDTQAPHPNEAYMPPAARQPVQPQPQPKAEPIIVPPAPVHIQEPAAVNKPYSAPAAQQVKSKKPWLMIVLIVVGVAAIGAGGWYAYNRFFAKSSEKIETAVTDAITTEQPVTETTEAEVAVPDETTETAAAETKPATKPMSRMDQELAKQKAKKSNSNQPEKQSPPPPASGGDLSVKVNHTTTSVERQATIIHEVGRKDEPKNKNPKNPAKLVIQKPTMLVRITTDHYNDGMGTPGGGTISIKDKEGNVIGTYKASGRKGINGTPSAKWVVEPKIVLQKGTYYIWDSDMSTWSKNFVGNGFIVVEGYEVQ